MLEISNWLVLLTLSSTLTLTFAKITETRIINGQVVDIAAHPSLVSIRLRKGVSSAYVHKCAGTIYTSTAVITAAQCFFNVNEDDPIMVVAGCNSRNGSDGHPYPVKKLIIHPNWNPLTIDCDIAILFLEQALDFGHVNVKPITIGVNRPAVGKVGLIAGWGYREEYGPSSYNLEEADVPIVSNEDCLKTYGDGEITNRTICAGYLATGGTDACQGDTGGPLVVSNKLVGLVSWGRGCARPGYPGVFTYVSAFTEWIHETITTIE